MVNREWLGAGSTLLSRIVFHTRLTPQATNHGIRSTAVRNAEWMRSFAVTINLSTFRSGPRWMLRNTVFGTVDTRAHDDTES